MPGEVQTRAFGELTRLAPELQSTAGGSGRILSLRRLWWAAIVLLGVSAGAVGFTIWQLRNDAIGAAVAEAGNIATLLAGQLSRSIQSIDAVLMEVKRSTKGPSLETTSGFRTAFEHQDFHEALTEYRNRLPQTFNIAIADRDGNLTVSTAAWPTPAINIADRDYFQEARDRPGNRLVTSIPIKNRIDGSQTIVFARRLENPRGDFAGVIFAGVNTRHFEDIYGSVHSVQSLIFTMLKADGTILLRYPQGQDFAGRRLSTEANRLQDWSRQKQGFRVRAQSDGNVRYVSVREMPEYPLFVNISVTEDAALASWWGRAAAIGLGSTILLLCSIYFLVAVTRKVRQLSTSEASLSQKSHQLDTALNNMSQGLCMFDAQHRLVTCNMRYAEMYGLGPEATRSGVSYSDIVAARLASGNLPVGVESIVTSLQHDIALPDACTIEKLADGRIVSVNRQSMSDRGWVEIHQDITSQKRAEAELAHMARYDALTGLANRALFTEKANDALARMRDRGKGFSVLMLDLDRFKSVNDSLGHSVGDSLLKIVAERLQRVTSVDDTVARFGGDEFAILHGAGLERSDGAEALAMQILAVITEPYDLDGRRVTIGTSIGITYAPKDGADADGLIKNADLALYKAKGDGGNRYRLFESSMEAEARERQELEDNLRRAIVRGEFELHYQTIVDVESLECRGVEVLVRWRHPTRGLLPPSRFVDLAEESGLIVPLGEWILRKACADAATWPPHLKLAVNLAPAQFEHGDLLAVLRSALAQSGLSPERLKLEITETVLLSSEHIPALLREIKSLGISIVLDDFGIGYSSLKYLQMFPIDEIKIDKSFIQSMTSRVDCAAIVSAIAGLGRNLDIETTAEGVETIEQFVFLRTAGCQLAQGYFFSRPVPLSNLSFDRAPALPKDAKVA
jgi:diguanylate cyclase (GGDEF)-like protein